MKIDVFDDADSAARAAAATIALVTGSKATMLRRLQDGDVSIPAGRIRREQAPVLADRAAAGLL
jgi:hypothetical protein